MLRVFLFSMLASACAMAQAAPPQTTSGAPIASVPPMAQQAFHPENVSSDAVVLEIQGVCSSLSDGAVKKAPCVTQITKSQFADMIGAVNTSTPMATSVAQRGFAESYVQLLALADAAEKAGIDKDPQFIELMKIVHIRTLGEAYRRYLENKANNPTPEELEAYYKQNSAKFETIKVERVIIPPVSGSRSAGSPADAAKKVKDLANTIRERAIKGEDMTVLQTDAYKTLGLPAPPNTDLGTRRRGTLPAAIEADLFTLKPGEVTKVEVEPSGFTIYRLRTHDLPSIDSIRAELLHDMHQQYVSSAIKTVEGNVHSNLNMDYFVPYPALKGPITRQTHQIQPGPVGMTPTTPANNVHPAITPQKP
jgi:PPIC-type PPIASE domain